MSVYIPEIVGKLHSFYGDRLTNIQGVSIHEHLSILADRMLEGLNLKTTIILQEFNNYHYDYLGIPIVDLGKKKWKLKDAQHCIANEYGFVDWDEVKSSKDAYHYMFEEAIDDLINGRADGLKNKLINDPTLVQRRSTYGHNATLLNYAGSNGVEFWRQQVPYNLHEMVALLIEYGADKTAKMSVYGGEFLTLELLVTSAHPHKAGVVDQVSKLLS